MARPGLHTKPKFKRLVSLLGVPGPHVQGYLEYLWLAGYESGDLVLGDQATVEAIAEYPGEPGTLFAALLNCGSEGRAGFIEEAPGQPGIYQIHHLHENAPEYVRRRMHRHKARCAKREETAAADRSMTVNDGQRRTMTGNDGQRPSITDNVTNSQHPTPCISTSKSTQEIQTSLQGQSFMRCAVSPEIAPSLRDWLEWWNELHQEGLVSAPVRTAKPSKAIVAAWKKAQADPEVREFLADREALADQIRASEMCREGWFRLIRLFGKHNKDGELIVQKLFEGGYRDTARRKPSPISPGQRHPEDRRDEVGEF